MRRKVFAAGGRDEQERHTAHGDPMTQENSVAVVGLSCRFPGAHNVEEYWRNLCAGIDSISHFDRSALDASGLDAALVTDPRFVPARGVVPDGELFDREFFGYSAAEAATMDPQHRVFLECAAQALDDAGIDPDRSGTWTGLFAGGDHTPAPPAGSVDTATATQRLIGREKDFLATRAAYKLDLRGPAITVQTACSTGLVAVHQACQALLGHECDVALAGAAALHLPQVGGHLHQEGSILSADGRCRAFDADASGTVNSGGVGVVVLKRLTDALENGDRIVAVIRGSAVNNDGREKVGYTAPSVAGQRDVIRMALARAGVSSDEIGYVEAHGTGTPVGDPVEAAALTAAFAAESEGSRTGPCLLGTVKANIGHTGAAAGIAGLIKTSLMLHHRVFVPTPHFSRPNPALDLDASPFRVSTEYRPWEQAGSRLAGVSSFGIGGTNAHLVLEEPPRTEPGDPDEADEQAEADGAHALCLSAATPEALHTLRTRLADRFGAADAPRPADAARTLAARRRFPYRLSVVARNAAEAAALLRDTDRTARAAEAPRVAFLFPGQGALQAGHGQAAHALLPVFREVFETCRAHLRARHDIDLAPALDPGTSPDWFLDTRHQQLGLFVYGYALARQLSAWGVTPESSLGHSVGEYAAAAVAGGWDRQDALDLVHARATAMHRAPSGRMLVVRAPLDEVTPLLDDSVSLATVGSGYVVVSGPAERIEALAADRQAAGTATRLLPTAHAFHSPLMATAADELRKAVATVPGKTPHQAWISGLTGERTAPGQARDPDYWARQLTGTIRLDLGMRTLAEGGAPVLVELGPGDSLTREAIRRSADLVAVPLLGRSPADERRNLLAGLARLWEEGVSVDWESLAPVRAGRICSLPPHPLARTAVPAPPRPPAAAPVTAPSSPYRTEQAVAPVWTQAGAARPDAYDVLLAGDPAGLGAALSGHGVTAVAWRPGALAAAAGDFAVRAGRRPLVIAVPPEREAPPGPDAPGVAPVLAEAVETAGRLGAPLFVAGRGLTDVLAAAPAAAAPDWGAWAAHHLRTGRSVALLDLGDGAAPTRLPAPGADAHAWRGGTWWDLRPRPVELSASTADGAPPSWTVVGDGHPRAAALAADLAEHGLPVREYVEAAPLPDLTAAVHAAVDGVAWTSRTTPLTRRTELSRTLDLYCAGLTGQQIVAMTGLTDGRRITDRELRRRVDPDRRLPALTDFCLRVLEQEGWLSRDGDHWQAADTLTSSLAAALAVESELDDLPGLKRMLRHVTAAYPDVFAGRRTPVSVLYPDADTGFLDDCLRDNRIPLDDCAAALEALRDVVRTATAGAQETGRTLRVLEIGAGAGRLTWPLLTEWPGRRGIEYHITDVSPLIVRRAEAHAAELGLTDLRFSTYDIGTDPVGQQLVRGSYDLVLGYNVVHVAESVPTALKRLAGLLRPGGRLGLVEVTEIARWSHVMWGLAPGWWDFGDELRTDSIHLDAPTWLRAIDDAGFTDVRAVDASLASDHVVVFAAGPGPRQPPSDGGLLYLPRTGPDSADRWREVRERQPGRAPAWVVTEDPDSWQGERLRRGLDPASDSHTWGHLEVPRVDPGRLARLLALDPPPGRLRLPDGPPAPEADPTAPVPDAGSAAPEPATQVTPAAPTTPSPAEPSGTAGADGLATDLAALWCEVLGTPAVGDDADFHGLGGDSLMLVQLSGLIASRLGHHVPVTSLPHDLTFAALVGTVRQLVPAVEQTRAPDATAPAPLPDPTPAHLPDHLTLLRAADSGRPLFLAAPATGSALCYRLLAEHLDGSRPVYGLDAPGLNDHRRPLARLEDIAAHHVTVLRQVQRNGPYLLGGWSYGAMVAHEMTRLLETMGESVELVVGIDGFLPATGGLPVGALPHWLVPSLHLQWEARFRGARSRRPVPERPEGEPARVRELAGLRLTAGVPDYVRLHNTSISALLRHRPRPVRAPMLLLKAGTDQDRRTKLGRRIAPLYGAGVTVRPLPGDHHSILGSRHVPALAAAIDQALATPADPDRR
ncbi:beta-ketoacyl synthase N-terminal-like domain-containing protein [Streptomyces sp. NPDC003247]|uniref:type I polyketide synthase n=1 Tax=Streptomyces sp. NPDC003247 TaxID=3364677 RepID=UPI00367D7825